MLKTLTKPFIIVLITVVVIFGLIQLIPYGRDLTNPPVVSEPAWDSPQTRELAKRACFDCHSNETIWPWYSHIAPASWITYRDAVEARKEFNFSDWQNNPFDDPEEIAEVISEGEMPPWQYLLFHAPAKLSQVEKEQLINGLTKTISR